jgi:hypothetical protein
MTVHQLRTGSTQETWFPVAPWDMRDAAYELLTQIPDFKKVLKVSPSVMAPDDMPCLVMALSDSANASGQGNQGALSFDHRSTLTISILCAEDSNLLAEGTIWQLAETVLMQLLRNQDFPREYLEGIDGLSMDLRIPVEGETFSASLNIRLEFTTRSVWEPIIPHKLRELVIERRLTPEQTETGLDEDVIYPDWKE